MMAKKKIENPLILKLRSIYSELAKQRDELRFWVDDAAEVLTDIEESVRDIEDAIEVISRHV